VRYYSLIPTSLVAHTVFRAVPHSLLGGLRLVLHLEDGGLHLEGGLFDTKLRLRILDSGFADFGFRPSGLPNGTEFRTLAAYSGLLSFWHQILDSGCGLRIWISDFSPFDTKFWILVADYDGPGLRLRILDCSFFDTKFWILAVDSEFWLRLRLRIPALQLSRLPNHAKFWIPAAVAAADFGFGQGLKVNWRQIDPHILLTVNPISLIPSQSLQKKLMQYQIFKHSFIIYRLRCMTQLNI